MTGLAGITGDRFAGLELTARTACSRTEIKSTYRCVCISACVCAACCCEIVAQVSHQSVAARRVLFCLVPALPPPSSFPPSTANPPCPCPSVACPQSADFQWRNPDRPNPLPLPPKGKEKIPILSWPVAGPLSHAHVHANTNARAREPRSTDVKVPDSSRSSRSSRVKVRARGGQNHEHTTPRRDATRHEQTTILHTSTAAVSGSVSSKALASRLAALSRGKRAST